MEPISTKPMYGYIYLTLKDDVPVYVGQSKVLKYHHVQNYCGSGRLIKKAIKKYGRDRFFTIMLDYAFSLEELNQKEVFYIKKYNTLIPKYGGVGYNISAGGDGIGTYKIGQSNPASSTNMSLEKRKEKSRKGQETYRRHLLEGKIKPRKFTDYEKEVLSQKAKERWKRWKLSGRAKEILSKIELHKDKKLSYKYALLGSKKAKELADKLGAPSARVWYARDPEGNNYTITIGLGKFCRDNNLSLQLVRRFVNKGVVPFPRPQNSTIKTRNTYGWVFTGGIDFVRKDCKRRIK